MTRDKNALSPEDIASRLAALPEWKVVNNALERVQTFPNFKDALDFVYQVGLAAEENDHHPDITMNFKRVSVRYWTHTARGISALDFTMAEIVEELVKRFYRPRAG
jgi:4a-hydroxytetrahydrobiopterin dehydratase